MSDTSTGELTRSHGAFQGVDGLGTLDTLLSALPDKFSVLKSGDRAAAWSFAAKALTPFRWQALDGEEEWAADASIANLGAISLIHMRHNGASLHSHIPPAADYYDVHFALSGASQLSLPSTQSARQSDLRLNGRSGVIVSPDTPMEMTVADGYEQFHVRIERAAVNRHLERILERPISEPLRWDPQTDLGGSSFMNWVRAVALLIDDLATEEECRNTYDAWASLLITRLLRAQANNYSDELERREYSSPLPRRVQRVVDHISANPESEYCLTELAAVMGASSRSLQRDFQTHLGMSPRKYIEYVRLTRAHDDLAASTSETVADIAYRWGFGHIPRFAAKYRERYGEAPSETLRKAKRTSGSVER